MTTRWLLVCTALAILGACSGEQAGELDTTCEEDGDCDEGFHCEQGVCEADDGPGNVDGGEDFVQAQGEAVGAPVTVEVETGSCRGPSCEIPAGGDVTFRAPETPGFRFVGWSGDALCMGTSPVLVLTGVASDIHCVANYVKRVTISGAGEGAPVASSEAGFAACEGELCEVDVGSVVTIVAQPVEGHRFAGFSGAGCEQVDGLTVTVTAGETDVVCTTSYVRTFVIAGSVEGPAEAGVTASSESANATCSAGMCSVDTGSSVTLTALELDGYRFAGWSGSEGCAGESPSLIFEAVVADAACVAHYVQRYVVSLVAEGTPTPPVLEATSLTPASVCDQASCEVDAGGSVVLSAATVPGYRLTGFSGEGCEAQSGASVTVDDVSADVTCTAHYVQGIAVIGNVVGATGVVAATATMPQEPCENGVCVIDAGSDVTLTAPTITGHRFLGWTGDPGCQGAAATLVLTAVTQSKTCNANYAARFLVRGIAGAGGSVSADSDDPAELCASGGCTVDRGRTVTLTASHSSNQRFLGWSGGGVCTGTSLQLVITNVQAPITCNASFIERHVVGFPDPANGTITASQVPASAACTSTSCTVDHGAGLRLTATADDRYRFVTWSGCSTSTNPVLDLVNITGPLTCTANFVRRVRVTYSAGTGGSVSAPAATCPSGSPCELDVGASLDVTATAAAEYRFVGWSAGCADGVPGTPLVADLVNITNDVTCTATFVHQWTVSGIVNPAAAGSIAARIGSTSCGGPSCTVDQGGSVTLQLTLPADQRLVSWTGGTGCSGSANPLTISNVSGHVACTANVTARYTVSGSGAPAGAIVASSSQSAPRASCSGASCTVDSGVDVTLAAPNLTASGWELVGWGTGCPDANTDGNAYTLQLASVTANHACVVSYQRRRVTVSVTRNPATVLGGISISATAGNPVCSPARVATTCTVDWGTSVSLQATATSAGYFTGWTGPGACPSDSAMHSFTANADATCTANYHGLWARGYREGSGVHQATGVLPLDATRIVIGATAPNGQNYLARRMTVDALNGAVLANADATALELDMGWAIGSYAFPNDVVGRAGSYIVLGTALFRTEQPVIQFQAGNTSTFRGMTIGTTNAYLSRAALLDDGRYAAVGYRTANPDRGILARFDGSTAAAAEVCVRESCTNDPQQPCAVGRLVDVERIANGFVTVGFVRLRAQGGGSTLLVQRWNLSGALTSERFFNHAANAEPFGMGVTSDGQVLIVGRIPETGTNFDAFWLKLDASLAPQAAFRLGAAGADEALYEAAPSADDTSFMLAGIANRTDPATGAVTADGWLVNVLTNGALDQQVGLGSPSNRAEGFSDIRAMPDGGYVAVGLRSNDGFFPLAMRVSDDADITFNATYGGVRSLTTYTTAAAGFSALTSCVSSSTAITPTYGVIQATTLVDPTETSEVMAP